MCGPEYSPPQFFVFSFHPAWSVAVVHLLSCVWLFVTPWTAARHTSMSFAISRSLLKLMSIKSMMPSNHLILCHPLLLLPSIFPSIWVFSSEPAFLIRWPKYWSFSFSICPSNEYSGLILLGLTSLLVWCPCGSRDSQESSPAPQFKNIHFFLALSLLYVQLSHPFMTTGKILNSLIFQLLPWKLIQSSCMKQSDQCLPDSLLGSLAWATGLISLPWTSVEFSSSGQVKWTEDSLRLCNLGKVSNLSSLACPISKMEMIIFCLPAGTLWLQQRGRERKDWGSDANLGYHLSMSW